MEARVLPLQNERLAALRRYAILDTPPEPAYDDIVRLASHICATPIAAVNFIDENRQWFKSEIGLGVRQMPLVDSICAHAILQNEVFIVPDTLADPCFSANPLCASQPGLRFYAGAVLLSAEGLPLGTLCVLDFVPRELSGAQKDALITLSRQVMTQLELHRNLKALRESEQLARSVIESSPDCVKVLDLEGRLLSMNSAGRRQMQIEDFHPFVNVDWVQAFWVGSDRDAARTAVLTARAGGRGQFSGCSPSVKGEARWWEVIVTPILNSEGQPVNLLCVSREITERRRTEEEMRQTAKLESLGVMAGGIAHDFNNLLTGILGNATLLLECVGPGEREMAQDITSAAQRAAELTMQMLAYSGKGRFESKRIHVSSLVREMLRMVQPSFEKSVRVILDMDDRLPEIQADPAQIQQLVMNLLINAAEALERKPGDVTIRTRAIGGDSPSVCLEVIDTGIGMSEETKARIFDPFFTTKFTGRGLGLAAVSGIVRGHKGTLEVETELGRGTVFRVLLPAMSAGHFDPELESTWSDLGGRGTILLVDDEEMVRRVGKASLERNGYEVLLAGDGREAMDVFAESCDRVSLVVLDMMMPVMNGEDALSQLQTIREDVPVIVSSGYDEGEVERRFKSGNIAGFIQKPYSASQLAAKIKEVLEDGKSKPAAAGSLD